MIHLQCPSYCAVCICMFMMVNLCALFAESSSQSSGGCVHEECVVKVLVGTV